MDDFTNHYCVRKVTEETWWLLGIITGTDDGYRFLSNRKNRRNSRHPWPTKEACVPRWVEKDQNRHHEVAIVTMEEWEAYNEGKDRHETERPHDDA
jgi:hypothetical protein